LFIASSSKYSCSFERVDSLETFLLEQKEYSYDRQNLAIWLSDRKENIEDIENNESNQALSRSTLS